VSEIDGIHTGNRDVSAKNKELSLPPKYDGIAEVFFLFPAKITTRKMPEAREAAVKL